MTRLEACVARALGFADAIRERWSQLACAALVATAVACLTASSTGAELVHARLRAYPLDLIARTAAPSGASLCHPKQLVYYRGTRLKLEPPSPVFQPFVARLQRLEETLVEIGVQVYGRAPVKLVHVGTFVCRNVEPERSHLSEHAFGNAIDVTGFRFPALDPKAQNAGTRDLPPRLRGAFTVSVRADYYPTRPTTAAGERHRRFFDALNAALREGDLFRTAIGPADSRHRSHLHLDMAPWPYVRL